MGSEGQGQAQAVTGATDFKQIKAILPSMHDVEIVGFFQSFERILELNEVDKALWARLLPSQLLPRALVTMVMKIICVLVLGMMQRCVTENIFSR